MRRLFTIWIIIATLWAERTVAQPVTIDFYGDAIIFTTKPVSQVSLSSLDDPGIQRFSNEMQAANMEPVTQVLLQYKATYKPDDWLFYQLIRKTAEWLSPKASDYNRYTLYKWWLFNACGYDATLTYCENYLLLYVHSEEAIYNIPYRMRDGKQFVCLNYHDYGQIDFSQRVFTETTVRFGEGAPFTYRVTKLPAFPENTYQEKEIAFRYNEQPYHFKVRLNTQVKTIFANYPVVDYASYFNIPLSDGTYRSLIPALKEATKGLKPKDGVDYLMRFTRYAFLFKPDGEQFGKEKRLSAEQTLIYEASDCDDRAALFFYLVKELYNLPMVVLNYPNHVTIAVKFDKPVGTTIEYNGERYTICEPTPQRKDLHLGQSLPELKHASFEIAYVYHPGKE